jgi:hypothetical protein
MHEKLSEFRIRAQTKASSSDVISFLNLIIFGLKVRKDISLLELFFPQFDFFNGTISGRFSLLGTWSGKGFVYALDVFGFRYIYEFYKNLYPEFPHMPDI